MAVRSGMAVRSALAVRPGLTADSGLALRLVRPFVRGGSVVRTCFGAAARARSASTAACMRCRNCSDSAGDAEGNDGADGGGPDRAAPRTRWGNSRPRSSSPIRV